MDTSEVDISSLLQGKTPSTNLALEDPTTEEEDEEKAMGRSWFSSLRKLPEPWVNYELEDRK